MRGSGPVVARGEVSGDFSRHLHSIGPASRRTVHDFLADPRTARPRPRRRLHGAPAPAVGRSARGRPVRVLRSLRADRDRARRPHDVRPHPHIGLATLTYLFDGAIMHRDSTGVVQRIEPGAVNWMSAGKRHRPLGAHAEGPARDRAPAATACSSGSRCRKREEDVVAVVPARAAAQVPTRAHRRRGRARHRRLGVRRDVAGEDVVADARRACSTSTSRAARASTLTAPTPSSARSTRSTTRSRSTASRSRSSRWSCSRRARRRRWSRRAAAASSLVGGDSLGPRFLSWNFVASRASGSTPPRTTGGLSASRKVPGETEFIPLPERRAAEPPPGAPPGCSMIALPATASARRAAVSSVGPKALERRARRRARAAASSRRRCRPGRGRARSCSVRKQAKVSTEPAKAS